MMPTQRQLGTKTTDAVNADDERDQQSREGHVLDDRLAHVHGVEGVDHGRHHELERHDRAGEAEARSLVRPVEHQETSRR